MSQKLADQFEKNDIQNWDQKHLVASALEFSEFQKDMKSTDKREHFLQYIR